MLVCVSPGITSHGGLGGLGKSGDCSDACLMCKALSLIPEPE